LSIGQKDGMDYTHLGRSGLSVSRLCLGTMNFGPWTSEADSFKIMDRALEAGINFFDTANVYGGKGFRGRTEEIVGRWLVQGGGRREKIVLATKVFVAMEDGTVPNRGSGLSAYKIRREIEESLRRLQTEVIDLYQMHHVDRKTPWDEIWGAFEDLIGAGKVVYAGSSNFAAWDIAHAQGHARERGFLGLVSEQHRYSLLCRQPELEVLPCCQALGVAVIPWSPLHGGVLSGHIFSAPEGARGQRDYEQKMAEPHRAKIEAYEAWCKEIGERPADVALAWMLANSAITAPIIGPRTMEQFEGTLRALEIKLDDGAIKKLDEIFPGPGGPAPEAYAW